MTTIATKKRAAAGKYCSGFGTEGRLLGRVRVSRHRHKIDGSATTASRGHVRGLPALSYSHSPLREVYRDQEQPYLREIRATSTASPHEVPKIHHGGDHKEHPKGDAGLGAFDPGQVHPTQELPRACPRSRPRNPIGRPFGAEAGRAASIFSKGVLFPRAPAASHRARRGRHLLHLSGRTVTVGECQKYRGGRAGLRGMPRPTAAWNKGIVGKGPV